MVVGAGNGLFENATRFSQRTLVTIAAISFTVHFSLASEETPPGVSVLSQEPCVAAEAFGSSAFFQAALVAVEAFVGFGRATLEKFSCSPRISITCL